MHSDFLFCQPRNVVTLSPRSVIAKQQRRLEKPPTVEAAFHAARMRRVQQDFVAVAPGTEDDARIIIALYDSIVRVLGASVLTPLGFPSTKLGLRSLVASWEVGGFWSITVFQNVIQVDQTTCPAGRPE